MERRKKILAVIPARGGSKGLPDKNIKLLNGKPLIAYSIEVAREIVADIDICVSTDSAKIIRVVEECGLQVPFVRPAALATDTASTVDVLLHALAYYSALGRKYEAVLLLQPTSPFRTANHVKEALKLYHEEVDMVVSVKKSHSAALICEENKEGFLQLTLNKKAERRQELDYYEYNGAIYIINVASLERYKTLVFPRVKKYVMDDRSSLDIDDALDYEFAQMLVQKE